MTPACLSVPASGAEPVEAPPVGWLPNGPPGGTIEYVAPNLLERQAELQTLSVALERAATGHGSTALVLGEAGIGKTSLIRAFLTAIPYPVRLLAGGCEDLLTPRTLGPLRDATRGAQGPLARALAGGTEPDMLLVAVFDELAAPPSPTVLVVEDAHWADGATLDVLRFLGRRMADLPALLVVTYRDDEVDTVHPLRSVLGGLTGANTLRLRLAPLTALAVGRLAGPTDVDAAELFRLTAGNPFYVTEVLASPDADVPPTVIDAVLARVAKLSAPARTVLERLAVVPSGVELDLLRVLQPDPASIAEAERAEVLTLRRDVLAFRHELARRTVAASVPASVRLRLHADVLRALLAQRSPDPFRVLHHAAQAGDDEAVVVYGQLAAREARRAGAHRQAAACYAQVLQRSDRLSAAERAALGEAYAWALSNSNQLQAAVEAAAGAVGQWQRVGADTKLVRALATLSRQQWLTEQTAAARSSAQQALGLAQAQGSRGDQALARLNLGGLLVLIDREEEGLTELTTGLELAEDLGASHVVALCRNYIGSAKLQLGREDGRDDLLDSIELAREIGNHEYVMRGFYNLTEGLWRLGHYDDALHYIEQADAYARDRDFGVYNYMTSARRYRLLARRGQWSEAVAGLHEMLDGQGDPGMIGRETLPSLTRLLVRQGHPDADRFLAETVRHAERADVLEWVVPAGLAVLERAWLAEQPDLAGHWPALLLERTDRPGTALWRAEILRYLGRLGHSVTDFAGCPDEFALGLRGDWAAAAAAWQRAGNPYEQALELAESGSPAETIEAVRLLDGLGAEPAARIVRSRLLALGVARMPRGPSAQRRSNAVGLTARQLEILRLIAKGMSNPEIAQLLVVSTRTIDHHVAAVLATLNVHSRREAAALLGSLDIAE